VAAPGGSVEALLAGIPNVEISYYEVRGDSLPEIRRALDEVRPRDPNDGLRVDALASWYIDWRWPEGADGRCDLSRAEIRFRAWVRLPRLVERATTPETVRLRWRGYAAVLARHEANHIRRAWERSGRVLAALRASTCANAARDGRSAIAGIGRFDREYDRSTRHGYTEGVHFP
jgi:predicted secreted Zn-dependent protease